MTDWKKGLLYTGIIAVAGGTLYGLGKLRAKGKLPLTALGLLGIVCIPKGFELIEKYHIESSNVRKMEIYYQSRNDSIDAVVRIQELEKAKKDTTTISFHDAIKTISEANTQVSQAYTNVSEKISANDAKYQSMIYNVNTKYSSEISKIKAEKAALESKVNELTKYAVSTSKIAYSPSSNSNNNSSNNSSVAKVVSSTASDESKSLLDKISDWYYDITGQNSSGSTNVADIKYYLVIADKSEGGIQTYSVNNAGLRTPLGIESSASFATDGGPINGVYSITNKGARTGSLFPGFLEMEDPVGISGAGDRNQYLANIQNGEYSNKTGIRVPNEIYSRLENIVDSKKTLIEVRD